ncbi:Redoxin [Dillenia turbinata]|uniref:Glutaredoxin-dependent peroxiredoxin n=1 Tax=Dillenia turbinata TaxID=194707 RepID=A0AAN8ZLX0_9MAGN
MALASSLHLTKLLSTPKLLPVSLSSPKPTYLLSSSLSYSPLALSLQPHLPKALFCKSHNFSTIKAAISVGQKLPDATLSYFDSAGELLTTTISDLTKSKKAILFAVPGAFTPTCSQKHLPGFVEKASELKAKGVDTIACISVNDAFVMRAWKNDLKIGDEVLLLSDGNREFTRAIGVELDLSDKPVGLGVRSRRYAMLAEDGVVKVLNLEEGGAFTNSSADDMLQSGAGISFRFFDASFVFVLINDQIMLGLLSGGFSTVGDETLRTLNLEESKNARSPDPVPPEGRHSIVHLPHIESYKEHAERGKGSLLPNENRRLIHPIFAQVFKIDVDLSRKLRTMEASILQYF